ncbi:hypothetical protein like AT3G48440 [Hibiscus trionum]|uniref:C3H1-type domain-containing protein n=1 Tax=Hibiscus trionum TaxID=183268 RepID=A0A9W7HGY5_HIBTR|nr:hypothetical protein like AT3G48440 [Hibiscus trionum]
MYSSASSLIKISLLKIRLLTDSALHGCGLQNLVLKEGGEEPAKKDDGERLNVVGDDQGENENNDDDVRRTNYPVRPEAEDCAYFIKTGVCKFGFNCKFNHPIPRKNQAVKEKDESTEKTSQQNCKYYLRTGGCKFGKACRYNHSKQNSTVATILEHNFLGLPIRKGERECPYYMRNGSCKYGDNCRFNHPDPQLSEAFEPPSGYDNGGSVSSQVNMASWPSPMTLNDSATAAYMPNIFSPTQGVPPPSNPEWNRYQTTVYPSPEIRLHLIPAYVMDSSSAETTSYTHHQSQVVVDEFPERPGQPECSYFLKNGDCKFKSNCKYHHPKNRDAKLAPCALSDKGLPLRPDQRICLHYSRYGICKFGPACKFDHSVQATPSAVSGLDQPPSFSHFSIAEQARIAGRNCADTAVQQSV